ncbi:uncharacterized protein LOC118895552 [Balaenoptera musculus]|uniref:Uncharacterized protein LOC118895552 n=1 Tax=Balaenoptera musculus TaxID=9771 RepID=A0A8B8XGU1_BALMU|nr:uncharacterized protein LOC118895552 [Balaenoptera musculus]
MRVMETWVFSHLSWPGQRPKSLRPLGLLNLRRRRSYFGTSGALDRGSHSRCKLASINSRCWEILHQSPRPEKEPLHPASPKSLLPLQSQASLSRRSFVTSTGRGRGRGGGRRLTGGLCSSRSESTRTQKSDAGWANGCRPGQIEDAMLGAVAVILNYEGYLSNGDRIHQSNRIEIMWLPHIGKRCITYLQTLVLTKILTTA